MVGNLPYHLTWPVLFALLDQAEAVSRAVFLLQREVAVRLAAEPGTKDWGLLSVLLQQRAGVTLGGACRPGAFLPPPGGSAVLRIAFRPPLAPVADEARFRRPVKAGFAQRRKVLPRTLAAAQLVLPDRLAAALERTRVDSRQRGKP